MVGGMGRVASFGNIVLGLVIWVVAISIELSWLTICFGTVVIGILLLIFLPIVLITPIVFIGTFANAFFFFFFDGFFRKNDALLRNRLDPPN